MANDKVVNTPSAAAVRPAIMASGGHYLLFLATSLALAVGLGFVLAILLSLAVSLQARLGLRWEALAQVHGHVQVVGFAGLFVAGMAYRLVPRFSGAPLRHAWTALPVYGFLLAAVLLRALTQPLSDITAFSWGPSAAACFELAGAALLCLAILDPLRRPLRNRQPWALFFATGAIWFVIQAIIGLWFLAALSLHGGLSSVGSGRTVLPDDRDNVLLAIQFYGFLLGFIFAVAARAIPTFFAHKPPARLVVASWSLLQLGLLLFVADGLLTVVRGTGLVPVQAGGLICLGMALIGVAAMTGCWKAASRLRASAAAVAGLLRAAFGWCLLAGVLDLAFGAQAWWTAQPLLDNEADAVRHLLAVGVVTTLIVGMGHLVVPALATQRLAGRTARWRLLLLQVLLITAVLLRAGPPLLTMLNERLEFAVIGAAGVLAWLAIALFAVFLWRAYRQQAIIIRASTEPHVA